MERSATPSRAAVAMRCDDSLHPARKHGQDIDFNERQETGGSHVQHREKEAPKGDQIDQLINWYSLVAKPIPRPQWAKMPRAQQAVDEEWAKLRAADEGRGTWDETCVRECWDVKTEAQKKLEATGLHTHFGALFDLCVEKHSELEEAKRRYKGRVVFGGHRVQDEYGLAAEFPDQGSGASFLTPSKLCDAVSLLPDCDGEQSDAPSAYTQSKLGTGMRGNYEVTWVEIPRSQWRPGVGKSRRAQAVLPTPVIPVWTPDVREILGKPFH